MKFLHMINKNCICNDANLDAEQSYSSHSAAAPVQESAVLSDLNQCYSNSSDSWTIVTLVTKNT